MDKRTVHYLPETKLTFDFTYLSLVWIKAYNGPIVPPSLNVNLICKSFTCTIQQVFGQIYRIGRDGENQSSHKMIGNAKKINHQTNFLFCTHLHVQELFKLINLVPDRWLRGMKTLGTRVLLAFKDKPRPQFFSLR